MRSHKQFCLKWIFLVLELSGAWMLIQPLSVNSNFLGIFWFAAVSR